MLTRLLHLQYLDGIWIEQVFKMAQNVVVLTCNVVTSDLCV